LVYKLQQQYLNKWSNFLYPNFNSCEQD
jgi:hypothetical protein